jgi:hypothetical protein
MTQYLVAIHHPDDYDPAVAEDDAMSRDIDALNDEMKAAGVRIFVGGLRPASSARSLRAQPDGEVRITDGPYLETKEHVGGFWVLEAADMGAQGRRRLQGAGRSAPVLLTELRREQLSGMDAAQIEPQKLKHAMMPSGTCKRTSKPCLPRSYSPAVHLSQDQEEPCPLKQPITASSPCPRIAR